MSVAVVALLLSSGCLPVIDENTADAVGKSEWIAPRGMIFTSQFVLEDHSLESASIHVRGVSQTRTHICSESQNHDEVG